MTAILKVDTIQDTSGNNIINESSDTITIGASGDTTNIIGTLQNNGAAVAVNTPAFFAYKTGSAQSISSGTVTKVTFNTELYDTDGNYASDRFTPQTAGKYIFNSSVYINGQSATFRYTNLYIRKNGSTNFGTYSAEDSENNLNSAGATASVVYDMNGSSDYVEVYAQAQATSPNIQYDNNGFTTYFGGYKIIT